MTIASAVGAPDRNGWRLDADEVHEQVAVLRAYERVVHERDGHVRLASGKGDISDVRGKARAHAP